MGHVLIVGLPKAIGQRVDAFSKEGGLEVDRVYAMLGKEGSLALIPRPEHCLPAIRKYLDTFGEGAEDYNGAHVLVLPYAPVPVDCVEELDVAASMGATVEYPDPNDDP